MSKSNISLLAQAIITALTPFVEAGSESASEIAGPWALTSCKEFFIPWNKEIHSATKTISKQGIFSRRRNLEDDFFTDTENAWLDQHGVEALLYDLDENNIPQLIELSDSEQEQVEDEKPTKKGDKPSKPGKKTPPTKKQDNESVALRKEAIININCLVKQHEVDYDFIVETLLVPFDVESFEDLPEENYKAVHRDVKAWVSWYAMLAEYKAKFEAFDAKHSDELVEEFEGLVDGISQLSFTELAPVYDEVKELHDQWADYYG